MLVWFEQQMVALHNAIGALGFIAASAALAAVCLVLIAWTTDLMVNNAAGLASRIISPKARTLVINASTNNPEAATMIVSMGMGRMGGWANPLGSLLANCYLMYLVAIIFVLAKWTILGRFDRAKAFGRLVLAEWRLVMWHMTLALGTFIVGTVSLVLMRYGFSWGETPLLDGGDDLLTDAPLSPAPFIGAPMYAALALLTAGVLVFFFIERGLKRRRPELFTDIDSTNHSESWLGFIGGTIGLIFSCWLMNALFLAWTVLYSGRLESIFGATVFAALHYVLGAFMTSLPELRVAVQNYQRVSRPDLNTALGSASYSNVTNLVITLIGLFVFAVLVQFGVVLPWE